MGYLLLTILFSSLVSVVLRFSGQKVKDDFAMLAVNYLICGVISALSAGEVFPRVPGMGRAGALGAVNGFIFLTSFALLKSSIQRNGVVLSSAFMKLGLLVSVTVSVVFFHETPSLMQGLGFVLALAAIVLMNFPTGDTKSGFKLGLILLLLLGGGGDAMSKIYEELGAPELTGQFLLATFASAFTLCVIWMLVKKQRLGKWELLYGIAIALPNFLSSRCLLGALGSLPAVIVYPVYSVGSILVVTLAGVLLFRERLEKHQWAGIAVVLAALVLLNV